MCKSGRPDLRAILPTRMHDARGCPPYESRLLMSRIPGPLFGLCLGVIAFLGPLAIHIYMPVIPAVKAAFGLSDALAQATFSVAVLGMGVATIAYGSLSDRHG